MTGVLRSPWIKNNLFVMGCFVILNLSKTCIASRLSPKNYGTKALSVSRWKSEIAIYVLNPKKIESSSLITFTSGGRLH